MVSLLPNSSSKSKQRWNAEHYAQIKVSINPEIAEAFKASCTAAGVSIAGVLSKFMAEYSKTPIKQKPPTDPYGTRRKRRNAAKAILTQMEQLALAEERCRDNIPDSFQNSKTYEDSDQSVDTLNEIIDLLREAY
jgi:ribosomal protein L34E